MTAFTVPAAAGKIIPWKVNLPTREDVRAMLDRPTVAATAIVCALVAFLALVGGVVYLVSIGKSAEALGTVVLVPLFGFMLSMRQQVTALHAKVDQMSGGSNG